MIVAMRVSLNPELHVDPRLYQLKYFSILTMKSRNTQHSIYYVEDLIPSFGFRVTIQLHHWLRFSLTVENYERLNIVFCRGLKLF